VGGGGPGRGDVGDATRVLSPGREMSTSGETRQPASGRLRYVDAGVKYR